jgi:outer membrane murein-binding lipoprotein Lpp
MFTLINILILFFSFLIIYQLILETNLIEGLENQYEPYDTNNPNNVLILAQQNAGNISYLNERLKQIDNISQEVQDLSGNVTSLQTQVNDLVEAQESYAEQITGGNVPQITGINDSDNNDNNNNDINDINEINDNNDITT